MVILLLPKYCVIFKLRSINLSFSNTKKETERGLGESVRTYKLNGTNFVSTEIKAFVSYGWKIKHPRYCDLLFIPPPFFSF